MSSTKIAKGSLVMLIGSFIFRIGGFVYRISLAYLLGPTGYGILGLTLPLIGVLQLSAEGGIPPAIAKYIAQYEALNQPEMIRQIIKTSFKLIIVMGFLLSLTIFILAKPLALDVLHQPLAVVPFQAVSLITPFSVITGELKGVFQGFYQMSNLVITKAFEQSFTIIFAIVLILANFYVAGAVIGTAIGYMVAGVAAFILFRKYVWKHLKDTKRRSRRLNPHNNLDEPFTLRKELRLVRMLLLFSVPVVFSSLGELFMYDMGTWVIGAYLPAQFVGYYAAASPIARLPLIISMAVATAVLPATSAALSVNDGELITTYINQAYRYVTIVVLPASLGIAVFATPIISLIFPGYVEGAEALRILALGMLFFTLYTVSGSISQGVGKPVIPMVALAIGTVIELGLSVILVPKYGINGAALATSIATFLLMVMVAWRTLRYVNVRLEYGNFGKIVIASVIMTIILLFIPTTYAYTSAYHMSIAKILAFVYIMFLALIGALIYISILTLIGGLKRSDVIAFMKLGGRLGPLAPFITKLATFLLRFAT
ncbi:MAG: oligosaccharide flippase family protein [Methanobacterium sp.]|jgi:stage V sporulation protein B